MTAEHLWIGLLAAVPVAVVVVVLALRDYDITLLLRKRGKKDEKD